MLEDGEYRIVMESIESYLEENSKEELLKFAEKYNMVDKLNERLSELNDFQQ